jgi:2'-5' RNA ligase
MIAIDVLIEPDRQMADRANSINARLRQNYPEGFSFDESHVPHITLAQRYVRATDVDGLASALAGAVKSGPTFPIELTATGLASNAYSATRVVVCIVARSPELLALASMAIDAVRPYAVIGGTADAFFGAPAETIDPSTIRYVEQFVPAHTGEQYDPHLTLGVARSDLIEQLLREPFEPFAFRGDTLAIYQLGNGGTARRRLWSLEG